jgi:uncharacterized protein YjbI with pentapeptide repeats
MSLRTIRSELPNRTAAMVASAHSRAFRLFVATLVVTAITVWLMADSGTPRWMDMASVTFLGILLAIGCLFAFPFASIWKGGPARPVDEVKIANDIRTMLFSFIGAGFALSTLYFTYQTSLASEQSALRAEQSAAVVARQQLESDRRAQLRDQLNQGANLTQSGSLEIRLAGLFAIDELLNEPHAIQRQALTLLTAYIRSHSPWTPEKRDRWVPLSDTQKLAAEASRVVGVGSLRKRASDVQAALGALGKPQKVKLPDGRLFRADLRDVDLQGAELGRAQLQGAIFSGAHLDYADSRTRDTRASFERADFQGATLFGAHLDNALLAGATFSTPIRPDGSRRTTQQTDLRNAHFVSADLSRVNFQVADLRGAELRKAKLVGADFTEADLRGARLEGADLTGADLTLAILDGATYDKDTKWPSGFYAPPDRTRIEE